VCKEKGYSSIKKTDEKEDWRRMRDDDDDEANEIASEDGLKNLEVQRKSAENLMNN